jgi:hypothetical protein
MARGGAIGGAAGRGLDRLFQGSGIASPDEPFQEGFLRAGHGRIKHGRRGEGEKKSRMAQSPSHGIFYPPFMAGYWLSRERVPKRGFGIVLALRSTLLRTHPGLIARIMLARGFAGVLQ